MQETGNARSLFLFLDYVETHKNYVRYVEHYSISGVEIDNDKV